VARAVLAVDDDVDRRVLVEQAVVGVVVGVQAYCSRGSRRGRANETYRCRR
jgi:hypothetical protein